MGVSGVFCEKSRGVRGGALILPSPPASASRSVPLPVLLCEITCRTQPRAAESCYRDTLVTAGHTAAPWVLGLGTQAILLDPFLSLTRHMRSYNFCPLGSPHHPGPCVSEILQGWEHPPARCPQAGSGSS